MSRCVDIFCIGKNKTSVLFDNNPLTSEQSENKMICYNYQQ